MHSGNLWVDHLFMLIGQDEVDRVLGSLANFGLTESSRRSHPGLGTSNVFYCFDNAFLEILWILDRAEAGDTRLGRLLLERLDNRASGSMPFGIGFRTRDPGDPLPFASWNFQPPAELSFRSIPIACSSDDSRQPFLFRAQRTLRPDAWTEDQAGLRQRPAGIGEITDLCFTPPRQVEASPDLQKLESLGLIEIDTAFDGPRVSLTFSQLAHEESRTLVLTSPLRNEDLR